MKQKNTLVTIKSGLILLLIASALGSAPTYAFQGNLNAVARLQRDAVGDVEITYNSQTQKPSFIRGALSLSAMNIASADAPADVASSVISRYADLFGIHDQANELREAGATTDDTGMSHVHYQQVYKGVDVLGGYVTVHLRKGSGSVDAITNGYVPNISLPTVAPTVLTQQALPLALKAMPSGQLLGQPKLVVFSTLADAGAASAKQTFAQLAWLIELVSDDVPARNLYVVDANQNSIITVFEMLTNARNRKTYDAEGKTSLPGTLKRSEDSATTNDKDVDNAHDFAGATYDYFKNTFQRDSFDNKGATLISTAHYGKNFKNAFWNGKQMTYGDGMPVKDVAAHELTHAVTENSVQGGLEYRWQSGALNESMSDIFGAMVDREDWLMGEDLPASVLGGKEAIRDLANPKRFGQPDHANGWVKTCSDNEGVHINSGIPNKAYYNIATAIGKDKAEKIFYRALTTYFRTQSSLEDARAAALQAATDLYGATSAEYNSVRDGFNAVGLDGKWNPPANSCTCAATTALADGRIFADVVEAMNVATALYRFRGEVMNASAGGSYLRKLYEQHTGPTSALLLQDDTLRTSAGALLSTMSVGLTHLANGTGNEAIVTRQLLNNSVEFLNELAAQDRAKGDGNLARAIETELSRIDTEKMVGMTYSQAWAYLDAVVTTRPRLTYLPLVLVSR
jgi:Zn-dependent metalloprotease